MRAATDPLCHGSPDIPRAAPFLCFPGDAGNSNRARARGQGDEGPRVRRRRRGARGWRGGRHFPEGEITRSGDINPFRPGIQQILATTPVPVVPMALRGLWGSFFSRSYDGTAMRRLRGVFSRVALVAAPAVRAADATADRLFADVSALRGDVR